MQIEHPRREDIKLEKVLSACANPLRLAILKVVSEKGKSPCQSLLFGSGKSTMTHHFRVLRESGVAWQVQEGRQYTLELRTEDLEARFPGLLDSVLHSIDYDAATLQMVTPYLHRVPQYFSEE